MVPGANYRATVYADGMEITSADPFGGMFARRGYQLPRDARTLAIHPATTTHSQMNAAAQLGAGVKPEMVRLSVGLETAKDIIADIDQALAKAV